MLAKYWKKIGIFIVIVACIMNVMIKLVNKVSLNEELGSTAQYLYNEYIEELKN